MSLTLHSATLIDGTGGDTITGAKVVVDDGLITSVGAGPSSAGESLDLSGLWLLPGLIDLHTHLGLAEPDPPGWMPAAVVAAQIFRNAELCLEAGFTTARELAGADGGLREAIDTGLVRGPRLLPSGPLLCQSGGHGDASNSPWTSAIDHHHGPQVNTGGIPGLTQMSAVCDGPDGVRLAVRRAFKRGATQIKMCASGGVVSLSDSLDDTQFTVVELAAAVQEARARGTYVTTHAHNVHAIRNGLEAGVACFEHATFLDEDTAMKIAAADASIVPTMTVAVLMAGKAEEWGIPEAVLPRLDGLRDAMAESIRLAYRHGVRVGSGSDLTGPEQVDRGREIALKSEVVGPMEAIISATRTNAEIIRMSDRIGTVEAGKIADLVALDFDPLREPEKFADQSHVVLVVKDGHVVKDTRHRA
ncbi:metal-dependent hydrolase family protein [Streptomyces fuscichromogenes]|uniref:Peptidase M38 n=1 Tax=Streptomyces fuscichromogenes TaxID=1324013 RepID=A0A917XHG9_9ACTN|nr:amidohydrolase family protein [Streptomyces fuscichromogenes]GGN22787.1 peptidase M38 [Streptomyces fuscichromogenes]